MADSRYDLRWWLTAFVALAIFWYVLSLSRNGPSTMFSAWSDNPINLLYWRTYPMGSKTAGSYNSYLITGPPQPGPLPGGAEPPYPKMDSQFPPLPVPK